LVHGCDLIFGKNKYYTRCQFFAFKDKFIRQQVEFVRTSPAPAALCDSLPTLIHSANGARIVSSLNTWEDGNWGSIVN
jgi:hypothetical protein